MKVECGFQKPFIKSAERHIFTRELKKSFLPWSFMDLLHKCTETKKEEEWKEITIIFYTENHRLYLNVCVLNTPLWNVNWTWFYISYLYSDRKHKCPVFKNYFQNCSDTIGQLRLNNKQSKVKASVQMRNWKCHTLYISIETRKQVTSSWSFQKGNSKLMNSDGSFIIKSNHSTKSLLNLTTLHFLNNKMLLIKRNGRVTFLFSSWRLQHIFISLFAVSQNVM